MSTWSDNLKIELLGTGDTNWGNLTNNNFKWAIEESITGYATATFPSDADYDWYLGYTNSNSSQAQRNLVINVTGSLTGTRNFVVPTIQKQYIIQNNTTGSQSIVVKTDAGTGITVPNGAKAHLYVDGTNVVQMVDYFVSPTMTGTTTVGELTIGGATTETVYSLSGTTPTLDPSNGGIQTWTLSGNSTPTDSLASGEAVLLMIDDGSAYTITWPSVTWKTNSGTAPPLNTTGFTAVFLWKVSTTLYGARVGNA